MKSRHYEYILFLNRIKICALSSIGELINHHCRRSAIRKVFCVCSFHSNAISRSLSKHVSQYVPGDSAMPRSGVRPRQHCLMSQVYKQAPVDIGYMYTSSGSGSGKNIKSKRSRNFRYWLILKNYFKMYFE